MVPSWESCSATAHPRPSSLRSELPMPMISGCRLADTFIDHVSTCIEHLHMQRHLTKCMRGATQTWIKSADHGFQAIEHTIGDVCVFDEMLCHLQHATIHRQIVMSSRDDQVGRTNQAMLINGVVMDQGATW